MIYLYTLIIISLYVLYQVIIKKEDKELLVVLIPTITILVIKYTRLSKMITDDTKFIITSISIVIALILIFFYLHKLIKSTKNDADLD